jgi:hypothetical protein
VSSCRSACRHEQIPFLCECADDRCLGRVELALKEFEQLHENENVYVIVRGTPVWTERSSSSAKSDSNR